MLTQSCSISKLNCVFVTNSHECIQEWLKIFEVLLVFNSPVIREIILLSGDNINFLAIDTEIFLVDYISWSVTQYCF